MWVSHLLVMPRNAKLVFSQDLRDENMQVPCRSSDSAERWLDGLPWRYCREMDGEWYRG
jgi:hypothetical protein